MVQLPGRFSWVLIHSRDLAVRKNKGKSAEIGFQQLGCARAGPNGIRRQASPVAQRRFSPPQLFLTNHFFYIYLHPEHPESVKM
jgi:hypothetical protein